MKITAAKVRSALIVVCLYGTSVPTSKPRTCNMHVARVLEARLKLFHLFKKTFSCPVLQNGEENSSQSWRRKNLKRAEVKTGTIQFQEEKERKKSTLLSLFPKI